MYYLNKVVWFFLNPNVVGAAALVLALVFGRLHRRRLALACVYGALAWFWAWSTVAVSWLLGYPLERPYVASQDIASLPTADAIVALGGGMSYQSGLAYPDMHEAADRVWHAARLWKAGKAPVVVVSGICEEQSTVPLLVDLGVPREAIRIDNTSRNTYENSRFTEKLLGPGKSVLLVTSAWHMRRASGNFAKTSLRVVPAPADFEAVQSVLAARETGFWAFLLPGGTAFQANCAFLHEWIGLLARR